MNRQIVCLIVTLGVFFQPVSAGSMLETYHLSTRGKLASFSAIPAPVASLQDESSPQVTSEEPVVTGKSPVKAFFLSLLLPGLGEWYTGHRVRSAAFLAVEGTAWGLWSNFRGNGKDWENRYIAFQAAHWSFPRYDAYRHAVWDRVGQLTNFWDPSRPLSARQQDSLSVLVGAHHYDDCCGQPMPSEDDRLEMIGKYYAFSYGWDDATVYNNPNQLLRDVFPAPAPGDNGVWGLNRYDWLTVLGGALVTPAYDTSSYVFQVPNLNLVQSANRDEYMSMRQKSNSNYSNAEKMVTVILFNHIISAIHAARLAKSGNATTGEMPRVNTSLRMALQRTDRDMVPMVMLWRRF